MSSGSRILIVTDAIGGVWTYSVELARALAESGVESVLAVIGPSPTADQLRQASGLRLRDTGLPLDWVAEGPDEIRRTGQGLARIANEEGVDFVQLGSAALAADVDFAQPVVAVQHSCVATWWLSVRDRPLPSDFSWRRDCVEEGLNKIQAVVAPTAAFAAQTVRAYQLGRPVYSVHNGRTPIALGKRSRSDLAFTVGRLWDDGKNVRTLDEAAARLECPFEAIGPLTGPNGTATDFAHLKTPGPLPPEAIADRLSARAIFASSALYEPFGLSVLEAAQAGCPLVLSDIPSFRELWSGAAIFVPATDAQGFATAISELLADSEKRERLGRAAQLMALQYTPAAMARGMIGIYRQLSQSSQGAGSLQFAGAA